ncbi:hypothetical protein [Halorussus ruber]|uniref:hypothetical protein n=1 Tax=Halorussus ruber TaxID=1126238 RepID=UPI001091DB60|nr:hypothetical protein [Halorussus ruber]
MPTSEQLREARLVIGLLALFLTALSLWEYAATGRWSESGPWPTLLWAATGVVFVLEYASPRFRRQLHQFRANRGSSMLVAAVFALGAGYLFLVGRPLLGAGFTLFLLASLWSLWRHAKLVE